MIFSLDLCALRLPEKVTSATMRDALRLMLVGCVCAIGPLGCTFNTHALPTDLVVADWAITPESGAVADGVDTAALGLRLTDPNNMPYAGITVCLAAGDGRVQLLAPTATRSVVTADANCALQAVTDIDGRVQADVAMLVDPGAAGDIAAFIAGYIRREAVLWPLYAPARVPFVVPASRANLRLASAGKRVTAGQAFGIAVSMYDADNKPAEDYRGTIVFNSNDAAAVLPPAYTFEPSDKGVHGFTTTLTTSGTQVLRVSDANQTGFAAQALYSVIPSDVHHLGVALSPNIVVAGRPATLTITAEDTFGNAVTDLNSDANVTLVLDDMTTLTSVVTYQAGTAQITLNADANDLYYTKANGVVHHLTVTDDDRAITGSLNAITVQAGPAITFIWSYTANDALTFVPTAATLEVWDAYGNTADAYRGTVTLTAPTDPFAVINTSPSDTTAITNYAFLETDKGAHTFAVTFKTATISDSNHAGTPVITPQSLLATDATTDFFAAARFSVTASQPFFVASFSADGSNLAPDLTANGNYYFRLALYDTLGNAVHIGSGAHIGLQLQTSDKKAVTSQSPITIDSVTATLYAPIIFRTAGTQTLYMTDANNPNQLGATSIIVTPGTPASLSLTGLADVRAGAAQSPTIQISDASGNIVSSYRGTLTFSDTMTAYLPAAYTFAAADNGVHTFTGGVIALKAGVHAMTVSDGNITSAATSGTFTTVPANPNAITLTFSAQNSNGGMSSCNPINATLSLWDAYGNQASNAPDDLVSLTVTGLSGAASAPIMGGPTLTATSVQGVAQTLTFKPVTSGTYTATARYKAVSTSQNLSIAQSTPTLTASLGGASVGGLIPVTYRTQGICSGTIGFNYIANAGGSVSVVRQAHTNTSQGSDLYGPSLGATSRLFIWDSPDDLGYGQSPGLLRAEIVDPNQSGPIVSNAFFSVNPNNHGALNAGSLRTASGNDSPITSALLNDINNDGALDAVLAAGSQLWTVAGSSLGQLTAASPVPITNTGSRINQIAVADLFNTGSTQVVACWNSLTDSTGHLVVYNVAQDSTLTLSTSASMSVPCRGVAVADFTISGNPVVVTANANTTTLQFYPYTGNAFGMPSSVVINSDPSTLLTGDLDRDGKLDFVVTSQAGTQIVALLTNFSGVPIYTRARAITLPTELTSTQVVLADINRDGMLDFVTSNTADSNVLIFLNNGSLGQSVGMTKYISTLLGSQTGPLVVNDFDGDGLLDIAMTAASGRAAAWYPGTGTGSFAASPKQTIASVSASTGVSTVPLATGDLDNDGNQDVLYASGNAYQSTLNTAVVRSNTDLRGVLSYNPNMAGTSTFVASGDVNNDGVDDLVIAVNLGDGNSTILKAYGDGHGHFTAAPRVALTGAISAPLVIDFNRDGYNDIVFAQSQTSYSALGYLLGSAAGPSAAASYQAMSRTAPYAQKLIVADFNQDGFYDAALVATQAPSATSSTAAVVAIAQSAAASAITFPPTSVTQTQVAGLLGTLGLAATDANDKTANASLPGINLLVYGSGTGSGAAVLTGGASSSWTQTAITGAPAMTGAVFGDFTGDSIADIAYVSGVNPNRIGMLVGQGNAAYASTPVLVNIGLCAPSSIVRLPMPQVTNPSFAVGCTQGGRMRAVYNISPSTGLSQNANASYLDIPTSSTQTATLITGDLNSDGRIDLVSVDPNAFGSGVAGISLAWGGATTSNMGSLMGAVAATRNEVTVASAAIAFADMSRDGALDLIVANSLQNAVLIYPNDGNGNYASNVNSYTVTAPVALEVGDLDSDGFVDVLVRSAGLQSAVTVLLNSNNTLRIDATTSAAINQTASAQQVALRDIDRDGYLDVTLLGADGKFYVLPWQHGSTPSLSSGGVSTPIATGATGYVFGDINRSGSDAVVFAGSAIAAYLRSPTSMSYAAVGQSGMPAAQAVALGDLDHDGALDVAYISLDGASLTTLKGLGDGTFQTVPQATMQARLPAPSLAATVSATLKLADLNRDGFFDAVIAWPGAAVAVVVPGAAGGAWGTPQPYAVGSAVGGLATGDINRDGRPDVIVSRASGTWPALGPSTAGADSIAPLMNH